MNTEVNVSYFPAGQYYVGDLCYALGDWDQFCRLTIQGDEVLDGDFTYNGEKIWSHRTAYGDGCFPSLGFSSIQFGVDSGLIGVAPLSVCDPSKAPYPGGAVVTFQSTTTVSYQDGTFLFKSDEGTCEIYTGDGYEDDEDGSYEDDEF